MRVLSLFSGGGLGDLGLMAAGMEIVGQCEIDDYCQKILALRYPDSIKFKDIRSVTGEEVKSKCGTIDVVAGGFPCQPFSVAGNQRGAEDDRHLWPEMRRVISEVLPTWVIGENVPGIIGIALDNILDDLEFIGYEATTFIFPAHALGAPHRRDRLWIVAHSRHKPRRDIGTFEERKNSSNQRTCDNNSFGRSSEQSEDVANTGSFTGRPGLCKTEEIEDRNKLGDGSCNMADTVFEHEDKCGHGASKICREQQIPTSVFFRKYWEPEPSLGRVANGVPNRVHRLKMLGNGQVPACTAFIGEMIMEFNKSIDTTKVTT